MSVQEKIAKPKKPERQKPVVALLIDWFAPGYLAGGPIRSAVNLVKALADKIDFYVITTDRDLGAKERYPDIAVDQWVLWENCAKVWYFSPENLRRPKLKAMLEEILPDVIYLNSMFSLPFAIWPFLINDRLKSRLILAPRGMLNPGALSIRKRKKATFLKLAKLVGIAKKVHFHATNEEEAGEIKKVFGSQATISVIPNLPEVSEMAFSTVQKAPGLLRLVSIARITPVKNLHYLFERLLELAAKTENITPFDSPGGKNIKAISIELSLYGPAEDMAYLERCKALGAKLPAGFSVKWMGPIQPEKVSGVISNHHLLVSPTLGENFGHAIFEALRSGRPVLISDRTPWKNLATKGIGAEVPLNDSSQFVEILSGFLAMDQNEFDQFCQKAHQYAIDFSQNTPLTEESLTLFYP